MDTYFERVFWGSTIVMDDVPDCFSWELEEAIEDDTEKDPARRGEPLNIHPFWTFVLTY